MTTRRNHFVPVWYQKGFVSAEPPRLYYLAKGSDESAPFADAALRPRKSSPKQHFWSQDLYTTSFFGTPNDEIERFLFGAIDNDGAIAVRAVAHGDPRAVHESFQDFFSYIDAQKIRTPKGLDWIRVRYGKLDQLQLMLEMQALRQMHCTMWLEAVREVVSAEASDVKFIVTDHPVTIYNAQCAPDGAECRYPEDPPIELTGSQTIFPLSANHCLILTNLEYAKDPSRVDLLRPRQNPRHFGRTLARTDAWIRTRTLSRGEVIAINYVLKSRAHREIAAAEEEWLYPERVGVFEWRDVGRILLPPENELWHFGGEIYVGHKDGTSSYQDAFGRTSRGHEHLRKEASAGEPEANQACRCGSGRMFEACCKDLLPEDCMPSDVYSVRERNLMFSRAIEDILGLNRDKSWEDARRELSDEQVKEIHTVYTALWPKDTNIVELLPRPDTRVFRSLYVGLIDPRTIAASVLAWSRYFDEVLVLNPFANAAFMRPEYSPIDSPAQYKEQTIKNVALLMALLPLIHGGVVHLIPDPMEFNDTLRETVWAIAKERRGRVKLGPADLDLALELGKDDLKRMLARLSDEDLRRQIRKSSPELADDNITEVMADIREEHAADPLSLIQPLVTGKEGGQLQVMRGINFELALFLAQLTGAAIHTDQRLTRDDLAAARLPPREGATRSDRVLTLRLSLDVNPERLDADRAETSSQTFRGRLRTLFSAILAEESPNDASVEAALADLKDAALAVGKIERDASESPRQERPRGTVFEIDAQLMIPAAGYGLMAVRRFLIAFGRRRHMNWVPAAILFGRAAATQLGADPNSASTEAGIISN